MELDWYDVCAVVGVVTTLLAIVTVVEIAWGVDPTVIERIFKVIL